MQHISDYWLGPTRIRTSLLSRGCQFPFPAPSFHCCLSAGRLDRRSESWSVPKLRGFNPNPPPPPPFLWFFPFRYADSGPPNEDMWLQIPSVLLAPPYEEIKHTWHHSDESDKSKSRGGCPLEKCVTVCLRLLCLIHIKVRGDGKQSFGKLNIYSKFSCVVINKRDAGRVSLIFRNVWTTRCGGKSCGCDIHSVKRD